VAPWPDFRGRDNSVSRGRERALNAALRGARGFSLPELLASMAILAVLATLGVYIISTGAWRDTAAARELAARLEYARAQAILENNNFLVVFDASGGMYTVVDDDDSDGTVDSGERQTIHHLSASAQGVVFGYAAGTRGPDNNTLSSAVTFPSDRVVFSPLGAATNGMVYISAAEDVGNGVKEHTRAVSVTASTARIRQWRYDDGGHAPGPWRLER
jgi:prepilin-type N-terminal cleavage/methylation domain-containing protein